MSDTLTTALEHPANDLRDLYGDHYPEAYINRGRTTAAWRDGDGDNVVISSLPRSPGIPKVRPQPT